MQVMLQRCGLLTLLMAGAFASAQAAAIRYTHEDCEYGVIFPAKPTTQIISTQDGQSLKQAQLIGSYSFLRAECAAIDPSIKLTQEFIEEMSREFSAAQGLNNTEFRFSSGPMGKLIIGRGTKTINFLPATYEFHCTYGRKSFICLVGGAASKNYPTNAIFEFFRSLTLN